MKKRTLTNVSTLGKLLLLSGALAVSFAMVVVYSYYAISSLGAAGGLHSHEVIAGVANSHTSGLQVSSSAAGERFLEILIIGSGFLLLLLVLLSVAVARGISRPMHRSVDYALKIARGDFAGQLIDGRGRDAGKLGGALNAMTAKLRTMTLRVKQGAEHVAGSSELINASTRRLAESSQSEASTLEETSAAVEELTASVAQVAESAQGQAAAMEQGSSSMGQVRSSIEEVAKTLEEISNLAGESVGNALQGATSVSEVVEGINLIAASSEQIRGIVTVISDIADQTNLLALNASIEAARAGEHGRGFAVVADEVSKLADRSSDSTKQIEGLIRESVAKVAKGVEIAQGSQNAMEQIRTASEKVREMIAVLSESVRQQVTAVTELSGVIENVTEMSQGISVATEEQTTNAQQVAKAVESVSRSTQEAASAAEEISSSTEELTNMALELMELTSEMKIGGNGGDEEGLNGHGKQDSSILDLDHIVKAIGAHGAWKLRLREAIHTGRTDWQVDTVRRDDACDFGKWLAKLPAGVKRSTEGEEVFSYHTRFHELVAGILEQVKAGKTEQAAKAIGEGSEFTELSSRLTRAMMAWRDSLSEVPRDSRPYTAAPTDGAAHRSRVPSEV